MRRWRGLKALGHDSVDAVTYLVGVGHASTARSVVRAVSFVPALAGPVRIVDSVRRVATEGTLGIVRGVNRLVEAGTDLALDAAELEENDAPPIALHADAMGTAAWVGDALMGAVNGVVGDHLHQSGNGLSLGMSLRSDLGPFSADPAEMRRLVPGATGRIVVLVHGLATTEWSWSLETGRHLGDPSLNFGVLLQRDLGLTPVYARYNTGRHVSENGRLLAERMEALLGAWPVPVEEIVFVGHSMGGLVVRSATMVAREARHTWLALVTRIVCLGTPHQGAPLERFGHLAAGVLEAVDLPGTRIPAAILRTRSAGIKDLRHGDVHDDHWEGRDLDELTERAIDPASLVEGITYGFFAGSVTKDPVDRISGALGDLLVPVPSAEGPAGPEGSVSVRRGRVAGVRHHEMQVHPSVYEVLHRFLAGVGPPVPG